MDANKLKEILEKHKKWLLNEDGGERANLRNAEIEDKLLDKIFPICCPEFGSFIYRIGEIVRVDNFDDNRRNECAAGIHFFITRQEAVDY